MDKQDAVSKTADYIKQRFENERTGHDWWHIYRVWKDSRTIAKGENVDMFIVEMVALLHDLSDFKFNEEQEGKSKIRAFIDGLVLDDIVSEKIIEAVEDISFKGAKVQNETRSKEAMIVQDADRLDAIGAMGIARAFAYGGKVGRPLYDPDVKPAMHESFEDYKTRGNSSTINHFYEKLLLLKDQMNTETAKKVAISRHKFMKSYLKRFYDEWEGKA